MFQCSAKRPRVNVEGPPPVECDYGALSGNLSIWTGEGGTDEGGTCPPLLTPLLTQETYLYSYQWFILIHTNTRIIANMTIC